MNENQVYREIKRDFGGEASAAGEVLATKLTRQQRLRLPEPRKVGLDLFWETLRGGLPFGDIPNDVRRWRFSNLRHLMRGAKRAAACHAAGVAFFEGSLYARKLIRLPNGLYIEKDYGLASLRVVTNAGVAYIVDAFQNLVELEDMKYHGLGTGTNAENATDTALQTELTTEYTGNVRATGTTTEHAANIYKTIATNTLDSGTPAITEHGVFSANAAGTLLDRSVFAAINLVGANGDALQTDYRLTLTAGG